VTTPPLVHPFAPDAIFDRLAKLTAQALGSPAALVSRLDSAQHELLFTGSFGLPEILSGQRAVLSDTLCQHVLTTGGPVQVEDVPAHSQFGGAALVAELGIGAYLGVPLTAPDGELVGVICAIDREPRPWSEQQLELLEGLGATVMTEINLRTSTLAFARQTEEREAIVESALDCIVTMDLDGVVRDFNPAAERTFGYSRAEAVGRRLGDLIVPPELRERHEQGLRRYLETGVSTVLGSRVELTAMRADGSVFPVELTIARVDGESPFFVGFLRDLTDAVKAETELRTAEARYRGLVENIPLVAYVNAAEPASAPVYISPQVEPLLGYALEDWSTNPQLAYDVVHPDDRGRAIEVAHWAREHRQPVSAELRFVRKDGGVVWVVDHTIPVLDQDGETLYCQGFLLDITERKQLEEQLRQSQKMEAIGQLAGGIAHDFNNMLTAINGYAELLGMSFEDGDPRQGDVDELKRAAGHAAALTRQLLAFSRKQVLLPQRLDANEIVSELELMLHRTIGEQIELETVLDPRLAEVEADRDQLAQVVLNIALNARDAMPAGGRLTIATRDIELSTGPHVAIEICDTGSGMDEETRLRVFEPFFTTKDVGKGTGLGLATAYGVVSQSGGSIEVESEEGVGSTFRVLLPRVAALSPRAAA
jgi:PAS domain S-box-containing protein